MDNQIPPFTYYGLGYFANPANLQNKAKSYKYYMRYMFARTQSMFKWDGLPDTIPQRDLELMIQTRGYTGIASVNGELYALYGSLGGEPNPYYMPTLYVVANPALKLSETYVIDDNCVIIPNDATYTGLAPLFSRYCTQLVENDLTMLLADINVRIQSLITAKDDNVKQGAEKYLKDVADGKIGIVMDKMLYDAIKAQPMTGAGSQNMLTMLIEYQQYLKASMFNDIGLDANYNMKRESLNSAESQMNDDALLPLIDDMLKQRKLACEKINDMFGTNITVDFDSIWKATEEELANPDEEEPETQQEEVPEGKDGEDDESE